MSEAAPHILFFEPDPHGHTREWIEHLCHFAEKERPGWRITFAVAPELARNIPPGERFAVVPLDARKSRLCLSASLPLSGFSRWWVLREHLKKSGADHGLVLCLDHLSLPLALGFGFAGASASGVLFRPSTHYRELDPSMSPTLKERIRDLRKRILYGLMLRNRALRKVLSLDPYFPSHAIRVFARGDKVEPLADPAFPLPAGRDDNDGPREDRTSFLLFGALAARKGILVLLAALREMDAGAACGAAVVIAGRVDPAIRASVEDAVARLRRDQPALHLTFDDRRLPSDELAGLVRRCDVVLAPYQRFVGSSGVLLWAANARKPVITQSYGLVGKLCRENGLGLAVDTSKPRMLADAIEAAVAGIAGNSGAQGMANFVANRTPRHFAATLFDAALAHTEPSHRRECTVSSSPHTGHASPYR
jgi:glycosyltransferase involved in cell wall biosynthesis